MLICKTLSVTLLQTNYVDIVEVVCHNEATILKGITKGVFDQLGAPCVGIVALFLVIL